MTGKDAEDLLLEDGEPYPPRVKGTVNAWIENKEDFNYNEERGCIPVNVGRDMGDVIFGEWTTFINQRVEQDLSEFMEEKGVTDELREIVADYWEESDELRERFKQIAYYCEDGSILENIKKVEEAGGLDAWKERENKDTSRDKGDDSENLENDDGDSGHEPFGKMEFPELYDIGVVNDSGNVVKPKLRGLVVAFVDDVDEIHGEGQEFDIVWVQRAMLYWGDEKFGDEWTKFIIKDVHTGAIYEAVETVYNKQEGVADKLHQKYEGGYEMEVGKVDTYDPLQEYVDDNTDQSSGEETTGEEKSDDDLWDEYEQEAEEKYETSTSTTEEGGNESKTTESTGTPSDLSEWGEAEGTTDRQERKTNRRRRADGNRTLSDTPSKSERKTTADTPKAERQEELKRNHIYQGNVYDWASKLPENSVDVIVTSPPYYALRDYDIEDAVPVGGNPECDHEFEGDECRNCDAWMGQLGSEPTPGMFIDHIVDLMERLREVLKPTGSLWLNIGDTYAGQNFDGEVSPNRLSRMRIPERITIELIDRGWMERDAVVWAKKVWMNSDDLRGNGKPFAGSSRIANQWEPISHFVIDEDYYHDVDSNRMFPASFDGNMGEEGASGKYRDSKEQGGEAEYSEDTQRGRAYNPLGTNPPDVWHINSDNYDGDHRAVFPEKLPKRAVEMSCPDRVCEECGIPYEKTVEVENEDTVTPGGDYSIYEQQCNCDAGYEPGVVLDPFLGSGTTALAAADSGFHWVGIELSEKYARLARKRIPEGRQVELGQW